MRTTATAPSGIGSAPWVEALVAACEESPAFRHATAWADTKLVLMFGDSHWYWKLYKSAVIDCHPFVRSFDPLGYDVSLRAEAVVWQSIAERRSRVWDHFNGFELEIGGNHLEAHRLHEALMVLCQDVLPTLHERGALA